jgi:hypothetical protein
MVIAYSMAGFFADNWGNIASVVGLVFSLLAFIFSKKASEAAKQARGAVLLRSFGEDMNLACKIAADMTMLVGVNRNEAASLRASELVNQTSFFITRWEARLSEKSKNGLLTAREQLKTVQDLLLKTPIGELPPKDRLRLVQTCQLISATFNEEYGLATKAVDSEVQ